LHWLVALPNCNKIQGAIVCSAAAPLKKQHFSHNLNSVNP